MPKKLKLEQFEALFNCKFCSKSLDKPITLPCGISICESHLDEIINDKCKFCEKQHPKIPYEVAQSLNKMIKLQANSIKLSPKFDACKESISKAKESFDKIDLVTKDPEKYICENFHQIKLKVDIRREELKLQIDNYSNDILSKIDQARQRCIRISKEMKDISKDIENYKTDLNTLIKRFDSFEFNDEKYDDILSKVNILHPILQDILDDYKFSLLDNTDHEFKAENMSMENVFGSFISYPAEKIGLDSKIINENRVLELNNLCEFQKHQRYQLIYRASEHGFSSINFHEKCDGTKNSLTIIKSENGNIFGGYTNAAWSQNGTYMNDASSFIFSLINQSNDPFKAKCSNFECSIFGKSSFGPTYRGGFTISSKSNINKSSFSNFGHSFKHKSYDQSILAGSQKFQTTEIEVFEKLN